ncbi:FAD-dependent oxidoreductase, partial [Stenotrophomonas sp. A3_2]|uniref:FAD-dependent oxidoreductase n=1 Tax=Stenotrophomonas sp. A3_2 TaxID=3119978 RepID=UPI002FC2924C
HFYGFPAREGMVKVAGVNALGPVDPDAVGRDVAPAEQDEMVRVLGGRLFGLAPAPARSARCCHTATPDHDFLVTPHPEMANVVIVSACSGHGFKHAAAVGETLAAQWTGET